jgi:regulator of replication initiation timing
MAIATPAPEEEAERRKKRRLGGLTDHWLPFVTALLTLIAAALGLWAAHLSGERNDLRVVVESQEESLGDLESTNSSLAEENSSLQEENAQLSEQLEQAQSTTTTTFTEGDEPPPPVQEVRRETAGTPLVIPEYDGFDLDSQESNWGVTSGSKDLYVNGGARSLNSSSDVLVAVMPGPPSVAECVAQTVVDSGLEAPQTVEGQHLCVRSNEGRWAYVRIADIDPENRRISFDVTVWKISTDP